jgi:magnesium transporter
MVTAVGRSTERSAPDGLLGVAAEYATESVPVARRDQRVAEVRGQLTGREFRCAEDVVVLESGRLDGLVSIERLLAADPDASIEDIMDPEPPKVAPDTDQERAARGMVDRHESSLAVVDADGRFLGLIPPYRMLRVLLDEHEEDLARLGGYLAGTARARGAAEEPVMQRLWHRLPWLLVGLLGAMAATAIVGGFEHQLETNVLLAFFIPAVVYMADAVGTQTETVLIRALAAGVTVGSVLRRELLTGLAMGIVIGGAFLAFALVGWGDLEVAVAVALAMLASCSIATLVATALPAAFQRLGKDPAFGSGPLATVFQDLISITVYLAIVVAVVV